MQNVERARTASETDWIPGDVACHARRSPGPAEREELEVERGAIAERSEKAANVSSGSRSRLDERGGVDGHPHCGSRAAARTASFVVA